MLVPSILDQNGQKMGDEMQYDVRVTLSGIVRVYSATTEAQAKNIAEGVLKQRVFDLKGSDPYGIDPRVDEVLDATEVERCPGLGDGVLR